MYQSDGAIDGLLSGKVTVDTQDGKVVFSSVEDSHSVNKGRTSETFKYDISGYVNAEREYSILYRAAVFDRVVELDRVVMD